MSHTAEPVIVEPSPLDLDAWTMRTMARQVSDLVVDHLSTLRDQPAQQRLSRADAARLIAAPPNEEGESIDAILASFRERVAPYHAREPHPRFIGYVPSCPTFAGVIGDWLASGFNFFSGVWSVAAGPNEVELTVLDWFRDWLGMPPGTGGLLTSGGSSATLTAMVAARHAATGDVRALVPRLTVYTSEQSHSSVARAAWIAGIPRPNVRSIGCDDQFRLRVDDLTRVVAEDRAAGLHPFCIAASAGTTNNGAVDPLGELADIAARESLW